MERDSTDARGAFERGQRCSLLARRVCCSISIMGQDRQAVGYAVRPRAADTEGAFGRGQRRSLLARRVCCSIGIMGRDRQAVGYAVRPRAADAQGRHNYSKSLLF